MSSELEAWAAIAVMAIVLFLTRVAGPVLMTFLGHSAKVERYLEAMSVSVVSAIVASALYHEGAREFMAAAVAIAAMFVLNSAAWSMVAGIVVAALWLALQS